MGLGNFSLKSYNTFGIDAYADNFIEITTEDQLIEYLKTNKDFFVLGGGSNIVLTQNIEKDVLYINNKGVSVIEEDDISLLIKVSAGEVWNDLVMWVVDKNYGGIENLSLIPGKVGASPIQNIGAYGVEVKDTIDRVEAVNITTGCIEIFTNKQCEFEYRTSVFKTKYKNKYIITNVFFRLKKESYKLSTSYGDIEKELNYNNIINPTVKNISDAIVKIRKSKLPDPEVLGNSGSFFKNPIVKNEFCLSLSQKFSEMPYYKVDDNNMKIPAGWLIEKAGFKGEVFGNVGSHSKQALVIVNYGGATGYEIVKHADRVINKVKEMFSIDIEMEVNII